MFLLHGNMLKQSLHFKWKNGVTVSKATRTINMPCISLCKNDGMEKKHHFESLIGLFAPPESRKKAIFSYLFGKLRYNFIEMYWKWTFQGQITLSKTYFSNILFSIGSWFVLCHISSFVILSCHLIFSFSNICW